VPVVPDGRGLIGWPRLAPNDRLYGWRSKLGRLTQWDFAPFHNEFIPEKSRCRLLGMNRIIIYFLQCIGFFYRNSKAS
jgi:hypothetical protein